MWPCWSQRTRLSPAPRRLCGRTGEPGFDAGVIHLGQVVVYAGASPRRSGWPRWRPEIPALARQRHAGPGSSGPGLRTRAGRPGAGSRRSPGHPYHAGHARGHGANGDQPARYGLRHAQASDGLRRPGSSEAGAREIGSACRAAAVQGLSRYTALPYGGGESLREIVIGATAAARVTMQEQAGE